jgi:hypothetical protein
MIVFSRGLTVCALALLLLSAACNFPVATPPTVETLLPTGQVTDTAAAPVALSSETPTTLIPVTGAQEVALQCQFCVNDEPHAALLLPAGASFLVSQPVIGVNCITAQVVGDRRILFCRGAAQTTFTLNVCYDNSNCLQYPITLETCPMAPAVNPTPVVLVPVNTGITPTTSVDTPVPASTQTAVATPLLTATSLPSPAATSLDPTQAATVHAPQNRGTPLPSTRLPRTALNTPEGFLRWYFESVWAERNYQDLWDNYLTPAFKARPSAGGYEGYVAWWSSVQRVDVNSITVLRNDGTQAWVRVNVNFTLQDGRVISNQEYDYDLLFDPARQTWMFDYRTTTP